MKIAISGKGGTGKTTLAGVMARILAEKGHRVLAIDSDPDSNLASAIGVTDQELHEVKPLASMEEFIAERTGAKKGTYGAFFQINPRVDDIPDSFSIEKNSVKLIVLGTIPRGGGGCFCPENALLKSLLAHVFIGRDEYVIVDMEAGLEHLGRGTASYVDALIVVVEPGQRSFQTAHQVKRLAADIGVRHIYAVGNKVTGPQDETLIRKGLDGFTILGFISDNEAVLDADKQGISPYDADGRVRQEVHGILEALEAESK